jgi:anti-sigma regulatory factor (Ser/Thr protein kinase)
VLPPIQEIALDRGLSEYMSVQVSERGEDRPFRLRLPATPASLQMFRDGLRDWLRALCLSPADVFDIVLACSESLTLVIEECPRQVALVVEVSAEVDGDRLVVRTRDYGLWDESHALPQEEPLGLSLMRALMDSVELERHADGQTVTLVRYLRGGEIGQTALLI